MIEECDNMDLGSHMKLAELSTKRIVEEFSWDKINKEYERIFKQ